MKISLKHIPQIIQFRYDFESDDQKGFVYKHSFYFFYFSKTSPEEASPFVS